MGKKKAIKIAAAAAVAASAFVSTTPAFAASKTSSVDTKVNAALKAGSALKKAYTTDADGKTLPTKQLDAAKAALKSANTAISKLSKSKKAAYQAKLESGVNVHIKRADLYIKAINAGKKVSTKKAALDALVKGNKIDATTVAASDALAKEIASAKTAINKVYGPSLRSKLSSLYVAKADASVNGVGPAVAAFKKLEKGQAQLDAKNLEKAAAYVKEANALIAKVKSEAMKTALTSSSDKLAKQIEDATAPVVESVSAINATQVEVKFNKAVDPASLFTNGTNGAFKATVNLTSIETVPVLSGTLSGELSKDGKTLTITAQNALANRYNAVVDGVLTTKGDAFPKYDEIVKFAADKTAPSIVSTTKKTASTFTVKFSEPINTLGTVSYKLADGTPVVAGATGVTNDFAPGAQEVTFTVGSDVAAGKEVIATFVGAQDQALNLLNPNPATVSFVKGDKDGVAPTVTSLTAVNNKTIEVKFSEELQSNPTITGFAGVLTFKQDATDKTKYTITSDTANTGLKSVGISAGYKDLSGETGAAFSKVLNFDLDTVAPKVASSKVTTVNGAEYLEVTFDEAVATEGTLATVEVTGTKLYNYVTTNIATVSVPVVKFVQDTTDKKVYRIALADLLGANDTKGATYSLTLTGKTGVPATVALVNDISGNAGPSSTKVSVTRNEDATAPTNTKATLDTTFGTNGILVNANKTITVRFNQELDGASAINVANYKFDGAVVEKAVLNAYGTPAGKQDVTLTLKDGSNTFTGLRNVTISGVKAKNGLVMDTVNTTESLVENVAPTVTSAKLTAPGVITLTFSEAVYNAVDVAAADFDLYVGGTKVTATTLDTEDVIKASAKNTLTLTVGGTALTAADLAKGLSIVAVDTLDIKDANDNLLTVSSVNVAQ